jgi:putative transposase
MAIPRKYLVDDSTLGFYHCISRCVRRAFLCGDDPLTGHNCDHRKEWLENRMLALASLFSVGLFAYAVMSNHYHFVLSIDPLAPLQWSDSEVAQRWLMAYPGRLDNPGLEQQRELKKQAIMADKNKLKKYRQRLGSLSWFMSRLNEPLAKTSNVEDNASGRFWDRFLRPAKTAYITSM